MLVHVIADFGVGDLAFAEVAQRLKRELPEAELVLTAVPPFATLAAGFVSAQLALNRPPPGTLVFHNVAPRRDDEGPRVDNAGERLAAAGLDDDVWVVGVHAGHAFSFLKQAGAALRYVRAEAAGSQFRSRDLFPRAVAAVARHDPGALGEPLPPDAVPDVPEGRIVYVDGFGNLKTSILAPGPAAPGTWVRVRVGGVDRVALATGGSFAAPAGTLALAPGSSGWPLAAGSGGGRHGPGRHGSGRDGAGGGRAEPAAVRFMELFLRGGSAAAAFATPSSGAPQVGAPVEVLGEVRAA